MLIVRAGFGKGGNNLTRAVEPQGARSISGVRRCCAWLEGEGGSERALQTKRPGLTTNNSFVCSANRSVIGWEVNIKGADWTAGPD